MARGSQTQPISEVTWHSPLPGARWLRTWRVGEWLQGPVSPLFETFLLPWLADAFEMGRRERLPWNLPEMWRVRDPSYATINGYCYARVDPSPISVLTLPPRFVWMEVRGGWLPMWQRERLPVCLDQLRRITAADMSEATYDVLLSRLRSVAEIAAELWYAVALTSGNLIPMRRLLRRIERGRTEAAFGLDSQVFRGFRTRIVDEQVSLYELAQLMVEHDKFGAIPRRGPLVEPLLKSPSESSAFLRQHLTAHLDTYGSQIRSLDFLTPCLKEDPGRLDAAIRCYATPGARNPAQLVQELARQREGVTVQILAQVRPRAKRSLAREALRRAQAYTIARDDLLCALQTAWPVFRVLLNELGARLTAEGVLQSPSDVYFLTKQELFERNTTGRGNGQGARVDERRALFAWRSSLKAPTHIPPANDPAWGNAMRFPINVRETGLHTGIAQRTLIGTPASPGRVRGPARILYSPDEHARLDTRDILVAATTTPNWTPLFSRAAGVVTDVGAATSHCSIVAREYGIPAVVGTQIATQVLVDGEVITVDGSTGRVTWELGRPDS